MATVSRGTSYGATETITNTKLHNLVDNATVTGIVDADIAAGAAISFSKIAQGNVDGALLTGLDNITVGAGKIPTANLASIANTSLLPINLASWVDGSSLKNLASIPTNSGIFNYKTIVTSLASGGSIRFDGVNNFVGTSTSSSNIQCFTSSGTFIAPSGITKVFVTMVGGGGGGAGSASGGNGGGGGGGGESIINYPYTVVPGNSYTVTVGSAGSGGSGGGNNNGTDGGDTIFDAGGGALTVSKGTKGLAGGSGTAGTGGAANTINASTTTPGSFYSIAGGNGANGQASGIGGAGGGSLFGSGGASGDSIAGSAGTGFGSGGGGGGSNAAGANGTSGICIVMY